MSEEKISEELARELIENIQFYFNPDGIMYNCTESQTIKAWKQKGYIKQSREDEIREIIKNHEHVTTDIVMELISILDKRLKDK